MEIKAERKREGQRSLVVVVELKGSAMAETRERIRDSKERECETDLVVEGNKSCGCGGGGVFVSWIEA